MAMMDQKSAEFKISRARTDLIFKHPFFATIAFKLDIIKKDDAWFEARNAPCKTMCTDGLNIYYYEDFVKSLTVEETITIIAHEVLHVVNLHHLRRQTRDPIGFNIACDFAINPILEDAKFEIPKEILLDKVKYPNNSAEDIYNQLPKQFTQQVMIKGYFGGDVIDYGKGEEGNEKGNKSPQELGIPSPEEHEQELKLSIKAAAQVAKQEGKLPGSLDRLVDKILDSVIPWKELLTRFMTENFRNDYNWFKPNKRYTHLGLYMPEVHSTELKAPIMMIDTSGSVSDEEMTMATSEAHAILGMFETKMYIFYIDSAFQHEEEFTSKEPINLHPKGGGGTDFKPGFAHMKKNFYDASCVLYITDGHCSSFPDEEPEIPVLWILNCENPDFNPPFGEIVRMGQ